MRLLDRGEDGWDGEGVVNALPKRMPTIVFHFVIFHSSWLHQ